MVNEAAARLADPFLLLGEVGGIGATSELIDMTLFLVCYGGSSCRMVSSLVFLLVDRLDGVPVLLSLPSFIASLGDATDINRARDLVNRLGSAAGVSLCWESEWAINRA